LICEHSQSQIPDFLEDVLKVFNVETDPSPNLSPTRGEALKTPFPCREGGKGG